MHGRFTAMVIGSCRTAVICPDKPHTQPFVNVAAAGSPRRGELAAWFATAALSLAGPFRAIKAGYLVGICNLTGALGSPMSPGLVIVFHPLITGVAFKRQALLSNLTNPVYVCSSSPIDSATPQGMLLDRPFALPLTANLVAQLLLKINRKLSFAISLLPFSALLSSFSQMGLIARLYFLEAIILARSIKTAYTMLIKRRHPGF